MPNTDDSEKTKLEKRVRGQKQSLLSPLEFVSLFESSPNMYMVLTPALKIVAANEAFLRATMKVREEILGQALFDVFQPNPDDESATGEHNMRLSVETVVREGRPDTMAVQKYDVELPPSEGGGFVERYWSPQNFPIFDESGQVVYVMQTAQEVTEYIRLRESAGNREQVEKDLRERSEMMQAEVLQRAQEIQKVNQDLAVTVRAQRKSEREATALAQELTAINIELERARVTAESANAAKSEFLSRMSHELRTPLNAVLGYAQLLEMQFTDPKVTDSAHAIYRAGKHLLNMINEVLELSKIETDQLSVSIEAVPVHEIVTQAIEILKPIAAGHSISVSLTDNSTDKPHVKADRQRLFQVVINLLNNAIKYNRKGGDVRIDCLEAPGDKVWIDIHDTGNGIKESDQRLLFKPFQRFGDPEVEGTGLGLVLSRRFVTLMGGELVLVNSSQDGTTFRVELERAQVTADNAAYMLHEKVTHYGEKGVKQRVLYIEDNLSNMRLLELVFEQLPDVELMPAMQGSLGIELAREHHPDLILLDLHLPDISGDTVLWRLKNDPVTASIPVIVVSADAMQTQIDRLKSIGASDYLTKPLDLRRLIDVVETHLRPPEESSS